MNKMLLLTTIVLGVCSSVTAVEKPRVIVTSDGEIDDECSMVRFLLYANEWDIEGVITSSSQYHWQGHRWAGDAGEGKTIHVICEVTDTGTPPLTCYQRVIMEVRL